MRSSMVRMVRSSGCRSLTGEAGESIYQYSWLESILNSLNDGAPPRLGGGRDEGAPSLYCGTKPELPMMSERLVGESALAMPSSTVILPALMSRNKSCSKVCEPGVKL